MNLTHAGESDTAMLKTFEHSWEQPINIPYRPSRGVKGVKQALIHLRVDPEKIHMLYPVEENEHRVLREWIFIDFPDPIRRQHIQKIVSEKVKSVFIGRSI